MGTLADALYLILSGEVACHQGGDSELRLAEGAFFGESSLSHPKSSSPLRQANVVAVSAVRCARLPAAHIEAILGPLQAALDRGFVEKVVSSIALFDPLSAGERALLLAALTTRQVRSSEVIIKQGEVGDTFFIVKAGAVKVVLNPGSGQPQTELHTLHGGEPTAFFGERSLLKHEAAVASTRCTPCRHNSHGVRPLTDSRVLDTRAAVGRRCRHRGVGAALPTKGALRVAPDARHREGSHRFSGDGKQRPPPLPPPTHS